MISNREKMREQLIGEPTAKEIPPSSACRDFAIAMTRPISGMITFRGNGTASTLGLCFGT
jgi:hypothetical protein